MKETTENNKLIAKFMGYSQPHPDYPKTSYWYKKDYPPLTLLLYHTSWDWIIPVINKCLIGEAELPKDISNTIVKSIYDCLFNLDINGTYKHTVDFIKWHNKQNK